MNTFFFKSFSKKGIGVEIEKFDLTKASQHTDISHKILKENYDIFADVIFKTLNDSFNNSIFPLILKEADVKTHF